MSSAPITVRPVEEAADRKAFVDLAFALNRSDPNWVPPLKTEVHSLIDPRTNPWFEHGEARFFLAERDGQPVGRISAQVDQEVLQHVGPGIGQWGMFEAADAEVAAELIGRAEDFLRGRRMHVAQGPYSISIWDEPGLLVQGFDHAPTVMMGHNKAEYRGWIEAAGYVQVKDLYTYDLDITVDFPPLVQRIVQSGERNPRIRIRKVEKKRFEEEAALILGILNDAWSDNWGFIPLSEDEIAYVGKKLKPIVYEDLIRVAEVEGEPVAFMITLPDLNEFTRHFDGRLFPFNWAKLLINLATQGADDAGAADGRRQAPPGQPAGFSARFHDDRTDPPGCACELSGDARRDRLDPRRQCGMKSIAETIGSKINRVYRIYEKLLYGCVTPLLVALGDGGRAIERGSGVCPPARHRRWHGRRRCRCDRARGALPRSRGGRQPFP
jgi:hypothetical protein